MFCCGSPTSAEACKSCNWITDGKSHRVSRLLRPTNSGRQHYFKTINKCKKISMGSHRNLTASYLWQPGEFARRMLGERPSPVPPTREFWPPQQLSVSTLQVTYQQDDDSYDRRASTLPPQSFAAPYIPVEREYVPSSTGQGRKRMCTVGTNTDPPPTIFSKLRKIFKREDDDLPTGMPPPGCLTPVPREAYLDVPDERRTRKALDRIKKAITGAKYRVAPGYDGGNDQIESPKISYDVSKPGDRMTTTFGASERKWCKLPTRAACGQQLRDMGQWCASRVRPPPPRPPQRRQWQPTRQITQV